MIFWCNFNHSPSRPSTAGKTKKVGNRDAFQVKLLGGIALTFYLIADTVFLTSMLYDGINDCQIGNNIAIPAYLSNFFGYIFTVILFTARIVKTFQDTKYEIERKSIQIVRFGLIPFLFLFVVLNGILRATNTVPLIMTAALAVVWVVIFGIYSMLLLRLFIKKLGIVVDDFIQQFGKVSSIQLSKLNKSVTYVYE